MKKAYTAHWEKMWDTTDPTLLTWDTNTPDYNIVKFFTEEYRGKKVLDVGCGSGNESIHMARHGGIVTGVDVVESALARAREKAQEAGVDVQFEIGDILDLSKYYKKFDVVTDRGCLHTLNFIQDRSRAFGEISKVLKPHGVYYGLFGSPEADNEDNMHEHYQFVRRRSILDIVSCLEPHMRVLSIRACNLYGYQRRLSAWEIMSTPRLS